MLKTLPSALTVTLVSVFLLSGILAAETMESYEVVMDQASDVGFGETVDLAISYSVGSETFASLRFLVSYDIHELEFVEATPGAVLVACGWESFDFQPIDCPGCDTVTVEIIAVADIENGDNHPACFSGFGQLVTLTFRTTSDTLLAGNLLGVNFYWEDCTSNTLTSINVDTVWHAKYVYDQDGNNTTGDHPKLGGTLSGCITPGEQVPIRGANYHNGGILLSSELGIYGDCNGDGKFNLADITYLIAYIFYGGDAPQDYLNGDFDGDGEVTLVDVMILVDYLSGN